MATWEDGPEYAPLEPPANFTVPDAPPLSVAQRPPQPPPAPGDRPQFGGPQQHVAPLATLVPDIGGERRDPHTPFEVDSDTMTQTGSSSGAWGAAHWRPPTGAPAGVPQAAGPWGPPTGTPASRPTDPMALQSAPASVPGGLPAPGTPAWFGPGPAAPARQQPPPTLFQATPPGAIIVLGIAIFWIVAPIAFLVAFILAARARYARRRILIGFAIVGAIVLLTATIANYSNVGTVGDWYRLLSTWTLLGSLFMIVLILVLVNTELKNLRGSGPGGHGGYQQQPLPPPPYAPPRPDQQHPGQPRHGQQPPQDQPTNDQRRPDQQQWPPTGQ